MSIKEDLTNDMKEALKSGEKEKAQIIRSLLSSVKNAEIDNKGDKLNKDDEIAALKTELKQRKQAIEEYEKGDREDLAQQEKKEAEIIEEYLPEQLSEEAIKKEVKQVIDEVGATGMNDMGQVMGTVMNKLSGKADGSQVRKVVEQELKD